MRLEELDPQVREKVRKLRSKLCEMAVSYKAVKPEECAECESPCEPGRELLKLLGMEAPHHERISDVFETVVHSRGRKTQRVVAAMNRRKL